MYALRVKKEEAEKKIREAKERGIFDSSRKVVREGEFVFIPVKRKVRGAVEKELPERKRVESLREKYGIGSYDIVGDIAIVFIPPDLWEKRFEIGKHLMKIHRKLRAVYAEAGATEGEFRIKPLELVAGEGSETVHRENGLRFKLDVTKVYFSPRQATERKRIVKYVREGDVVAVFFAGICPIPVYISKFSKAKKIYAIEKNPWACRYARENIEMNRCANIELICGNVREEYRKLPPCDLVIMPLPKGSLDFLEEAREVLKAGGRVVIYVASREEELDEKVKKIGSYFEIEEVRREKEIAPREYRFVVVGVRR